MKNLRRRAASLSLATALITATAMASAAEPSLSDRETAHALMDEGDAKRDAKDLQGALKAYEAADAIMHVPTTAIEVARTQVALGQLLEARETLARLARSPAKPGEPAPFTAARKQADALYAELGAKIPSVAVELVGRERAQAQAVEVAVDGQSVPPEAANVPRKVNPGKHVVVVRAGGAERTEEVMVAEGEARTITVDLASLDRPSETPTKTAWGAEASSSDNVLPKALIYGGFATAAVGIGIGTVTGLMSLSKVSSTTDGCEPLGDGGYRCDPSKQGDIDSARTLGNVSTVAFIVGAAGVGAGVVGLILNKGSRAEAAPGTSTAPRKPHVQADVGPTWVGLRGTF